MTKNDYANPIRTSRRSWHDPVFIGFWLVYLFAYGVFVGLVVT